MKKIIALFCFIATMQNAIAQTSDFRRDSLYQLLKQAKTSARQVKAWVKIGEYYCYAGQPDSLQ